MTDLGGALFGAVADVSGTDAQRAARVRALVAGGASLSARDDADATPLHRAVEWKAPDGPLPCLDVVRALVDLGAEVDALDAWGLTPLVYCVALDDGAPREVVTRCVEVLEILGPAGASFGVPGTHTNASGYPLGGSLAHNTMMPPEVYAALLERGVSVNRGDLNGDTPLHSAVQARRPRIMELLLAHGADTAKANRLGHTPLAMARSQQAQTEEQAGRRDEVIALLEAAGARARPQNFHPVVDGLPLPTDMRALREAAAGLPGGKRQVVQKFLEEDYGTYQELAEGLHRAGPDAFMSVLELCAAVLSPGQTRTLADWGDDGPFFHHGDLVVPGEHHVSTEFLVTGSLTVEGCIRDCGPDSLIVVGGDVTARGVYTSGDFYIRGSLKADVVYGCYNDNCLDARVIRSRLVIEDDHSIDAGMEADDHFDIDDYRSGYGEGVQERLRELLVDDVFKVDVDDDWYDDEPSPGPRERLDPDELFSRLAAGEQVFRTG